eukprot:m.40324 g.40324  ORF g.40324 m.40324 type:complete len:542 (-) comp10426_c0_seq1:269-1894(-)
MPWFSSSQKKEKQQVYFSAIDGLKRLYKKKIKPVEDLYKYDMYSSPLCDADFDARPQVLLLGQYSVGKTSFIRYLLGEDFPGAHIGPEPTTDRFMAIMHGPTERLTPGNALAVQDDKPFRGLTQFGTAFLQRLECAQMPNPVLENLTFIDSPGVLSGEKQRVQRGYDFTRVIEWFAGKADMIILLFDAHKLDISDEFKRAITALKNHDEKIRVVLNKADTVDTQQLMRVYGALMWSLGKVTSTPEVKRVFISSFWDQDFKEGAHAELFEKERDDLLQELYALPRYNAVRKINELVKRARYVKVHALLIGHIKGLMPSLFGKSSKQRQILDDMPNVFRAVQREHKIPFGDFPDIEEFKAAIKDFDFSNFPKLDLRVLADMDAVLSSDVPKLMNEFPPEREDEARLRAQAEPAEASAPGSNPFDTVAESGDIDWAITMQEKTNFSNTFAAANPQDGLLSGEAAKGILMKSRLPVDVLSKIWKMSDIDGDGSLDLDEFCVAMHLCHKAIGGQALADSLPANLVPPSKRRIASSTDPFDSAASSA